MSYPPVVVVDSGGVPRTQVAEGASAPAFTVVDSGARPITLADNCPPIALFNPDGSHWTAASPPAAFVGADWSVADLQTMTNARITIDALPDDGGSPITDLEYSADGGDWVSLSGTSVGTYDIGGLEPYELIGVVIRARNVVGPGDASNSEAVTPTLGSALVAWWTADRADLITLNSTAVTSWKDVVAGYDAVQGVSASRPIYSATSFNGAPGCSFDGVDDEVTATDAAMLLALPDGAEPGEIWSIFQQNALAADTGQRSVASHGDANTTTRTLRRAVVSATNRTRTTVGTGGAANNNDDASVNLSSRHVARSLIGATETQTQVDGGALTTATATVPATSNVRARIGATSNAAAAAFWSGIVRDVLFTTTLTADQVTALNAWALPRRML